MWSSILMLCCVLSCCVLSCRVLACCVLSCCVLSCRVVSCRVVSCRVVPVWERWASGRRLPWPPWCGCFPDLAAATAWGLRRREHASLWWKPCHLWPRRPTLPTPRPRPAETPPAERRSSVIVSPHDRGSRIDNSFIVSVQLIKPVTSQFWIKVLCAVVCCSASWSHVSTSLRLSARKTNRKKHSRQIPSAIRWRAASEAAAAAAAHSQSDG